MQFINNGKIILRTIGMIEVHQQQTSSYLKSLILDVCLSCSIRPHQISSVTIDNGANLV